MVQTNVAPNALRTSTITPRHTTKFAINQVCDHPGLNVIITVLHIRCDKFVIFSARQVCIRNCETPRSDGGS